MYESIGVGEALLIALCGFVTVFLLLLFLIVIVTIVSRVIMAIEGKGKAAVETAPAPVKPEPVKKDEEPSKPWDGKLQLIDVDDETAACIMAIISDETDIPLDELQFRRIRAL